MTDSDASILIARIYAALQIAEARHPNSLALGALHGLLAVALEAYIADHSGVVRPFDGGQPKPGP